MTTFIGITLEDWTYLATIFSALGAAIAFWLNVRSQIRQRSIDNCTRYLEFHGKLFTADSYLCNNVAAMEAKTYTRDTSNKKMEAAFREMLSEFEKIALLQKAGGAPTSINAYMLGYFAKNIFSVLTDREKAEPYWELATDFVTETKKAADNFDSKNRAERAAYISKNHF